MSRFYWRSRKLNVSLLLALDGIKLLGFKIRTCDRIVL
ncbi:hypothetical protein LEP1GSC193_0844 [Leptospira alstonii serovar Pingchang str. 80-412]|uniref:Uncharacterized protein n=2 Tax=Leptospira alstonii TaxID=28452 RepID=M6D2C6_9LEPT|nr:hypothetical protein LEP1GSC194_3624 [Leptospira alstonii serovar Sichuan str. 79601]EQA80040.1 hypothetical protein LEP1GSC193_0844 [Leptospira alstonii serovar Pingchang str. 80-412]